MSDFVFLKVKIKSLMAASKILRKEERKRLGFSRRSRTKGAELGLNEVPSSALLGLQTYHSLHYRRTVSIRVKARAAQLAYGYLRGRELLEIEPGITTPHAKHLNWELVYSFVRDHSGPETNKKAIRKNLVEWISKANLPPNRIPSFWNNL